MSDPHIAKSQTGYIFSYDNITISWKFQKQTLVATFSNDTEVISLHEASKQSILLRSVTKHIQRGHGLSINNNLTIL